MTELTDTNDDKALRRAGIDPAPVQRAARVLAGVLRAGGQLLTAGNGGSAADAQHVAAELVGRFERERPALPAVALTVDSSALTAIGNDYGFEHVFSRQVRALGRPGDMLLAISTSGTSANILRAVDAAREIGLVTVGLTGPGDSPLSARVDIPLSVPGTGAAAVQELHLRIEHAICRGLERELYDGDRPGLTAPGSVVAPEELRAVRERLRDGRRTVVWTNGCFDLLHAGHLASLRAARALGDVLVVGVNGDASVRRLKGEGRPLVPAAERMDMLAALRPVDYVVGFDEDTPEAILEIVRPDIATKGAEYAPPDGRPVPEREVVERHGGRMAFLPLVPDRSTTALVAAADGRRG